MGHKNLSKLIILLIILTITSSFLLLTSGSTLLQQNNSSLNRTETLFSLLEESNSTVLEIIQQLEKDGVVIQKASYDKYDQAQILVTESQILFQSGNYSGAEDKIIQSLASFKEVLNLAYASINNKTIQNLTSAEKHSQIQSSINRYYELLTRIQNLANFATQAGFDTTNLQEKIHALTTLLARASTNLEQNRFNEALGNIAEAKRFGEQLTDKLKDFATFLKTDRLDVYIENTTKRLDLLRRTTTSISSNYPTSTIDAVFAALDDAESSISNAKSYLENYQINDALTELANSKANEEQAVNYLQSDTTSEVPSLNDDPIQNGPP